MYLLSLRHAWRRILAFGLVSGFALAPARAQQAARDSARSKMPMNMQMGTPTKKKKPAAGGKARRGAKMQSSTMTTGKDASHMNMPNMPSKPDSAHMNMPSMQGHTTG